MIELIGRTAGAFFFGVFVLRTVGRKTLARMNYVDFLMILFSGGALGRFARIGANGPELFMIPITLLAATRASDRLARRNRRYRQLIEGKPVLLIKNGKILEGNLAAHRFNQNELLLALRQKGIFNLTQVEYAILETNGRISVMKKSSQQPVARSDLGISAKQQELPSVLISNGEIIEQNLVRNNLNINWLEQKLKQQGIYERQAVFLAALTSDGSLYVDVMKDS